MPNTTTTPEDNIQETPEGYLATKPNGQTQLFDDYFAAASWLTQEKVKHARKMFTYWTAQANYYISRGLFSPALKCQKSAQFWQIAAQDYEKGE